MDWQLKLFSTICVLIFLFYVIFNIQNNKLSIKHALIWIIMSVVVIICILCVDPLGDLASIIGIETFANFMFFLGFIFLLFITFSLTRAAADDHKKITKLNQEIALLKKKLHENENKK